MLNLEPRRLRKRPPPETSSTRDVLRTRRPPHREFASYREPVAHVYCHRVHNHTAQAFTRVRLWKTDVCFVVAYMLTFVSILTCLERKRAVVAEGLATAKRISYPRNGEDT